MSESSNSENTHSVPLGNPNTQSEMTDPLTTTSSPPGHEEATSAAKFELPTAGKSMFFTPKSYASKAREQRPESISTEEFSFEAIDQPEEDLGEIDETLQAALTAAESLSQIPYNDSNTWDETVKTVCSQLQILKARWSVLEAERKVLTKATHTSSSASGSSRGRGRGRGRGRRRGRWRGSSRET